MYTILARTIKGLLTMSPIEFNRSVDQAVFVLGDFNRCYDTSLLPDLHQSVTCPTRLNKTIDLCYSNIPDAFGALCRPVLERSDYKLGSTIHPFYFD